MMIKMFTAIILFFGLLLNLKILISIPNLKKWMPWSVLTIGALATIMSVIVTSMAICISLQTATLLLLCISMLLSGNSAAKLVSKICSEHLQEVAEVANVNKHNVKHHVNLKYFNAPMFQVMIPAQINIQEKLEDLILVDLERAFMGYNVSLVHVNGKIQVNMIKTTKSSVKRMNVSFASTLHIFDSLPWYLAPIGVRQTVGDLAQSNSMLLWKMHGTPAVDKDRMISAQKINKRAGKSKHNSWQDIVESDELQDNQSLLEWQATPQMIALGDTSERNKIALCLLGYALVNPKTKIFVHNPDHDEELNMLKLHPQTDMITHDLVGAYEIVKNALYELTKRYLALNALSLSALPLTGRVQINDFMSINGFIMRQDERIHTRLGCDERDFQAQDIQPGMEMVIRGDKRFRIPHHWEIVSADLVQRGGVVEYGPILFVFDHFVQFLNNLDQESKLQQGKVNDEDSAGGVSAGVMLHEILNSLNIILKFGRNVNMHAVLLNDAQEFVDHMDKLKTLIQSVDARVVGLKNINGGNLDSINHFLGDADVEVGINHNALFAVNQTDGGNKSGTKHFNLFSMKLLDVSAQSVLLARGISKSKIVKFKKAKITQNETESLKLLSFDQYHGLLPDEMPEGVNATYGKINEEIPDKFHGDEVEVAGRKLNINQTSKIGVKKVDLEGLYGGDQSLKVGSAQLPEIPIFGEVKQLNINESVSIQDIIDIGEKAHDICLDKGRVDDDGEMKIVGDQSSMNSLYSEYAEDEDSGFNIVK